MGTQENGPTRLEPSGAAKPRVTVTVIGFDGSPPGPAARRALAQATLVVGNIRHLDALPVPESARRIYMGGLGPALTRLALHDGPAVVVASGDPGYFGVVRALREQGLRVRTVPAVSSVAGAFGRIGLAWEDALVVAVDPPADGSDGSSREPGKVRTGGRAAKDGGFSAGHGASLRAAANLCRAYPKVAVLTGEGAGPRELAVELLGPDKSGPARTLVVAQRLGEPEESVEWLSLDEAAERHIWGDPCVVLCLDEARALGPVRTVAGAPSGPSAWALDESAFAHRDSMITKFEVRALALARLGPRLGDHVWDIGAGSGSVAVECARLGAAVTAVEKTPDGVERVRANAVAHGVDVRAVHGAAPTVLSDLDDPDAVFVGGGGRELPAIVTACARRARRTVVVAMAALDRVPAVREALTGAGFSCDGVLLQSSRLAPLPGDVTRLAATNPVFLLWGYRTPVSHEGVAL